MRLDMNAALELLTALTDRLQKRPRRKIAWKLADLADTITPGKDHGITGGWRYGRRYIKWGKRPREQRYYRPKDDGSA